eukprot:COSAG01_NODE_2065_length_8507_cov_67.737274_6_plen_245_part_00
MGAACSREEDGALADDGLPRGTLTLDQVRDENYNTKVFSFVTSDLPPPGAGPSGTWCLGLTAPIGKDGAAHKRMYTPIASSAGMVELMIKVYDQGVMSKHVHGMSRGDTIDFVGPKPKLDYKPNAAQELGLIAGGTGITPMLQLIKLVLADPDDKTKIMLLYGNKTERDVLAANQLGALQERSDGRLQVVHYITEGGEGRIDGAAISKHVPNKQAKMCICGPPTMTDALTGILSELGYGDVFKF